MLTLKELETACHLYGDRTNFDESYRDFLTATNNTPDLSRPDHRDALLHWLRRWYCRQFARRYSKLSSQELLTWHGEHITSLVPPDRHLWELPDGELRSVGKAYESLSGRTASYRRRDKHDIRIRFGPAGTAKILFALRPRAFLPWDIKIRKRLGYGKGGHSYVSYLGELKVFLLRDVAPICRHHNLSLTELPQRLKRPRSSVPKIIDEYLWVTLTADLQEPNPCVVQRLTNPSP